MPKELNLPAYDYRNNNNNNRPISLSRSPSNSNNDSFDEDDDSSLRRSCGTAYTYGNDTVMTGDHVEAILRRSNDSSASSSEQRKVVTHHRQMLVARTTTPLVGGGAEDEEQDDESSSDSSEGVVPKVCRRSHSRSNSVGSTELIAQVKDAGGSLFDESDGAFTYPPHQNSSSGIIGGGQNIANQYRDGHGNGSSPHYGAAMGGNEALLRVRQQHATTNSNNNNGSGGANNQLQEQPTGSHSGRGSNSSKSSSSSTSANNNVYHIHDNISALSSVVSGGSMKSKSSGESKSFIAAVLNYGHISRHVEGKEDGNDEEEEDEEERLVKSYSHHLEGKQGQGGKNKEEQFENDEESQQLMKNQDSSRMHHRHSGLIDVPHYHNIRSSFTGLVGQIKDRATSTSTAGNNNKEEQQQQQEAAGSQPPPPPVNYSDHRQDQEKQQQHDPKDSSPQHHQGGHTGQNDDDDDEEEEEQHYDLRPQTVKTTTKQQQRRFNRRPIQRRTTTESEMWNRRLSTESESMWTMLSTSFTRRSSNESESSSAGRRHFLRRRDSAESSRSSNGSTAVGAAATNTTSYLGVEKKKKKKHHQQTLSNHDDNGGGGGVDEEEEEEEDNYQEEKEPYDDSDIRSVKSMDSSWIGMGNLGNIIGSNIVSGGSSDMNGGRRMKKRGVGDGRGDYHYGNDAFSNGSGRGGKVRRFSSFFVRRASMTPFIGEDGGDYFYHDDINGSKSYFYRPGITTLRRCGAICILIAITALSSVLIGIYIPPSVGEGHNTIGTMQILDGEGEEEEELFKIAESINQHCEMSKMHSAKGRRKCERLCKNHLCCFDMIGDGYGCRDDDSKNCGVYSGCEVLVDSFEGQQQEQLGQGNGQVQKGNELDDAVSLDGGFGDGFEDSEDDFLMLWYDDDEKGGSYPYGSEAIFYNPGGQSTTTTTQEAQIGSLSVDNVCTESMVKTLDGRRHCETLCKDHHCCFDPVQKNSCRKDPDKMCPAFAKCEVLTLDIDTDFIDADNNGITTHDEIKIGSQVIGAVCAETKVNTPSGKQECEAVCSSHLCCFSKTEFNCRSDPVKSCPAYAACEILNVMAAEEGKANGVVYWDDQPGGDNDSDPHNAVAAIQLNDEQKLQIKQEVNKNCKNKSSPDCFHACRDWFCCFEPSDEKSCRSSTNNLCNLVQQCEVAAVNAENLFSDSEDEEPEQLDDQEQDDVQAQPSSQQQIQPQPEDDYYQDDFLPNGVFNPFSPQMQEQDIDLSQQSSFRPQQEIPQQQDDTQSSVQQQQDDDFNQEDDFLPEELDEFQPPPSTQQQDNDLQQSSLRPQQQAPQQQGEAQYSVQPIQQQDADLRPQPAQQQQQQQDAQQQYDFQPSEDPQQQGEAQYSVQPIQQQDADFRPQPAQQQQQQQQPPQQQNQNNYQQQDEFFQPQQQDEFFQPQQQNDFQSQNNFQPPMQQQYDQNQSNMQPPPPPQQQNGSQSQQQYMQPQTQQPITPQQQNGQRLDQPNEQQQFEVQPQQPMEENNFQPPIQPLPQQQQSNTNAVASKPPRPPPARCILTGDDEMHTELYNDDWNDDSYDRCKRWETKYGMKVSEYMDLYGVG